MNKNNDDFMWKYRILCSDESCIGVIGPNKCCRECGRRYEGELPPDFEKFTLMESDDKDQTSDVAELEALEADNEVDDEPIEPIDEPITDDEWANRILCSDENCIGVIGPDGRCKDCGKALEDAN